MARLVHLAPERLYRRIERSGLRGNEWTIPVQGKQVRWKEAIFAMPSFRDEQITYQWVRELRSWRQGTQMVAVTFEVDSSAELLYGRFGRDKQAGTHEDAYASIQADPWGAEVVVSGPIPKESLVSVRSIRQDIGWQGTPEPSSHGDCPCPACLPSGHPKLMRRIRAQFNGAIERIHGASGDAESILNLLSEMSPALERGRGRLSPKRLLSLAGHADPRVRKDLAGKLGYFRWGDVEQELVLLFKDADAEVRNKAIETVAQEAGARTARSLAGDGPTLLMGLCAGLEYSNDASTPSILDELRKHEDAGVRNAAEQCIRWRAD